jgi:hypothetical protein
MSTPEKTVVDALSALFQDVTVMIDPVRSRNASLRENSVPRRLAGSRSAFWASLRCSTIDQPLRGEYSRGKTGLGVGEGGKITLELKGYEEVADLCQRINGIGGEGGLTGGE